MGKVGFEMAKGDLIYPPSWKRSNMPDVVTSFRWVGEPHLSCNKGRPGQALIGLSSHHPKPCPLEFSDSLKV